VKRSSLQFIELAGLINVSLEICDQHVQPRRASMSAVASSAELYECDDARTRLSTP
jgi:hypothetical protein